MNIYEIFDFWKKCSSDFIDAEYAFIGDLNSLLDKVREEKKYFAENNFNIFSLISEAYRPDENVYEKENPNSEILKILLDPNTTEIGNPIILKEFLKFIGLEKHEEFFPDLSEIQVKRERYHIDLYIHNDENSIIVESKLYGARHQDFQLARYYLEASKKYNVKKIVYLTLNPIKELNLEDLYEPSEDKKYSMEEQKKLSKVVPKIKPLITYISARNGDKEKSLSVFFDRCSEEVENELSRIILKEYSKLLLRLAGEQNMTSAEKNLIKRIYEDEKSIQNALDFIRVWERKDEALHEIFADKFKETYLDWKYDICDRCFYKEVNGYYLFIYKDKPQIGFWAEKFTKSERKKLSDVLVKLDIGNLKLENGIHDDENWVYMDFIYDNEPIDLYFESVVLALKNLESRVSQLN